KAHQCATHIEPTGYNIGRREVQDQIGAPLDKRQLSPAAMLPRLTLRRNAGGSLTCPPRVQQFDSKEMTMTPTEWLILRITTFVVVIVLGVWFYRINSD